MSTCPICSLKDASVTKRGDHAEVSCLNCGAFSVSNSLLAKLEKKVFAGHELSRISYGLRRAGGGKRLDEDSIECVLAATKLASATEMRDNLLLYVSEHIWTPGETVDLKAVMLRGALGASSGRGVRWAIEHAVAEGWLSSGPINRSEGPSNLLVTDATLTPRGWERVEALLSAAGDTRRAFMAMKFGDPQLDAVFRDHFKPAIKQAGFDLMRLDDEPRAGLIDDRLRLEIRRSRFLVADLTHSNPGAYWEAGFAEGLGRPVIYTCRKDVFENAATKPHFDTNHHLTVVWDPSNLAVAAEQLKTVIRVTLPLEAMIDDPTLPTG